MWRYCSTKCQGMKVDYQDALNFAEYSQYLSEQLIEFVLLWLQQSDNKSSSRLRDFQFQIRFFNRQVYFSVAKNLLLEIGFQQVAYKFLHILGGISQKRSHFYFVQMLHRIKSMLIRNTWLILLPRGAIFSSPDKLELGKVKWSNE